MPGKTVRDTILRHARHVVVKVGTNTISDASGQLDLRAIGRLGDQIAAILQRGVRISLVASGAIGAGRSELGLAERPTTLPQLQATASVGQGQLMRVLHDLFAERGVRVGQILLTRGDFHDRRRYLNIRNTLSALGEYGVLPIINENDTVAVDEIRFGDNDVLAALLTNMQDADLLVLLTNVDGVLKDGRVLDVIEQVDDDALALADGRRSSLGSGGMASKLEAAGLVTAAGEAAVIANGATPDVLLRLLDGEELGTVFVPADRKLNSRQRWIAQASQPVGQLVVDAGAVAALAERGKSLLPSGLLDVRGQFEAGETVAIVDEAGREIARGLTNYDADQLRRIRGCRTSDIADTLGEKTYDEVVHRNNMALS